MKRLARASLFVALFAVGTIGCKKIIKAIFPGIDVELPAVRLTVPVIPVIPPFNGPASLPRITQRFNLDSIVKANTANKFGSGDVTSVKVKEMTVTIVDGANAENNLSNFENIKFNFSSNSNTSPVQVASFDFPDTYTTTANIASPNSPELVSYLRGSELYYDIVITPRRSVTQSFTVAITATVTAK